MKDDVKSRIDKINLGVLPIGYIKENRDIRPNDWYMKNIGETMEVRNNLRIPISEEERKNIQGNFPYYGPTKIQDYIDRYNLEGEHVLIGEDGDHFLKYREKEMTLLVDGKFNVNNHAHILKGTDICTTRWFFYYFQHRNIFNYLTRQGAGRYKLTKESLQSMTIALPSIHEQQKITNILSIWDEAIDLNEKLIKQKKEQKRGLMQKLLTGEVRLVGFDGEWEEKRLGDISKIVTGTTPSTKVSEYYGGKFPWITPTDINDKKNISTSERTLTDLGMKKGRFVPKGSLLLTCIASIGKNVILDIDGSCNQQINAILPSSSHSNNFLYYLISYNTELLKTYAGKSATPILNKETLSNIILAMPSIDEQEAIGNILSMVDKSIDLCIEELENLKLQKKGLMQLLLTGIVRVKV